MGKPEPRLDGRLKVTGEARYGSDFVVSNPAYAFLVTSPIAKGRIESMDLRAAKAVPGVLEIFNYENTGELKDIKYAKSGGGPTSSIQGFGPLIQYGGQIVALVVADTFEAAREAAHTVRVNYASEPPSATFDSRGVSESAANEGLPQAGDAEQAYAAAGVRLEAQYETPTQHHNPIELFTTTCVWRDNQLTIYEPSQFVYGLKANAAKKMGIDIADVRAVSPFVGGAFGSNEIRNYTILGGNGVCLTQLPAGLNPAAIQVQVFGIPTTGASGDIEMPCTPASWVMPRTGVCSTTAFPSSVAMCTAT